MDWKKDDRIIARKDDEYHLATVTTIRQGKVYVRYDDDSKDSFPAGSDKIVGRGRAGKRKKGFPKKEIDKYLDKKELKESSHQNKQNKQNNKIKINGETRQKQINDVAWKVCDTFRGVVDPSEYKNYILTFLFLKYLSDLWKDKREEYTKTFKGDKNRVKRRMARERFVLPEKSSFDYLYENRNADNIGDLIDIALSNIEEANKAKLEGVFRNISFNSEANLGQTRDRNARLKHLLEDFSSSVLDLRPSRIGNSDIIGNTYMYLISKFASDSGKKGGEFYTPDGVAMLLAKLMQPERGDRICDPTCGSGSLLIRAATEIGGQDYSLYGQESNGSTWALARMNMFLHERDQARLEWGDTLRNPRLIEGDQLMKFDIVVANPPFSLDKWGADEAQADRFRRFHRGIPPKSKGDYAFITHMIETAVETGKVGVIVPHGVLFRGAGEGKIREALVEENYFEAGVAQVCKHLKGGYLGDVVFF